MVIIAPRLNSHIIRHTNMHTYTYVNAVKHIPRRQQDYVMNHVVEEQLILRQGNPEYCKRRKKATVITTI